MINFLPEIYEDELLYSIIGRYSNYNCNCNHRETLELIFGNKNSVPTIEFPSHLRYVANEMAMIEGIDVDYIIDKHTMYPYYSLFLPKSRQSSIKNKMINEDGKGIKMEIGFIAGSICKKSDLFYCPKCVAEETAHYGEAYFHRLHQAQGVFVCPKHQCLLYEYPVRLIDKSRISFIQLEHDNLMLVPSKGEDSRLFGIMLKVALGAEYLLSSNLSYLDKNILHLHYLKGLKDKGFLTISGRIHQQDLGKAIIDFYGDDVLKFFESEIDVDNEYNWVKVLTRKGSRVVHPLRNLLLIYFLTENIESFLYPLKSKKERKEVYPCLNPASNHYKQLVISNVLVTLDSKSKEEIGTFKCDCGFTYSRRMNGQANRIGRIKQFGVIWEEKLRKLILESEVTTTTAIAREMRCDYKTVVKYASKLGLATLIKTNMNIECPPPAISKKIESNNLNDLYINTIINYLSANPDSTYCEIRNRFSKQFSYLYKHNKDWIDQNLPKSANGNETRRKNENLWFNRDSDMLRELIDIHLNLLDNEVKRITKTMLMRKTGKQTSIEKNLDKLPLCKEFLDGINNKRMY